MQHFPLLLLSLEKLSNFNINLHCPSVSKFTIFCGPYLCKKCTLFTIIPFILVISTLMDLQSLNLSMWLSYCIHLNFSTSFICLRKNLLFKALAIALSLRLLKDFWKGDRADYFYLFIRHGQHHKGQHMLPFVIIIPEKGW